MNELAIILILGTDRWEEKSTPPKHRLYKNDNAFRCCEPLVDHDNDRDTINLAHQSAKDYLLSVYPQLKGDLS